MPLILSLLVAMLLAALGSALVMATITERGIAAAHQRGSEAFYAADGAAEYAIEELGALADWTLALDGTARSSFLDGAPSGTRVLPRGGLIDLTVLTNSLRCGRTTACTSAQMDASTSERPWGANNPRWELFACGRFDALPADPIRSSAYVVVWIGDDPAERDNLPLVDGQTNADGTTNGGAHVVVLVVQAYGAAGSRRAVELTVARQPSGAVRLQAWRELRQ
jgi:hypothetical protein